MLQTFWSEHSAQAQLVGAIVTRAYWQLLALKQTSAVNMVSPCSFSLFYSLFGYLLLLIRVTTETVMQPLPADAHRFGCKTTFRRSW